MTQASITVNLVNPGHVFASLGFLEVADVILDDAEGGFDWSNAASTRFYLRAASHENPFAAVLQFLAEANVRSYAPVGFFPAGRDKEAQQTDVRHGDVEADVAVSESYPDREGDRMALPVRLQSGERIVDVGHWADGTSRDSFKLYAGNRTGYSIASDMLRGKREKPKKNESVGTLKTRGVASLWNEQKDALIAEPFDVLTPIGGSFNFDPRGGWTAIDAGYSPNDHADHVISASPVVEILAACGLEHARPLEFARRHVRYGAWAGFVPPVLARPALAGVSVSLTVRRFRFALDLSGKNKVVTFAQEEKSA